MQIEKVNEQSRSGQQLPHHLEREDYRDKMIVEVEIKTELFLVIYKN